MKNETLDPDRFRIALDLLGWSKAQAAEEIGVSPRTIHYWMSGEVAIPLPAGRLIRMLCDQAGVVGGE